MNETKITGADILKMCPGLKEAMSEVLDRCRDSVLHEEPIEEAATEDSIKKVNSLFSR